MHLKTVQNTTHWWETEQRVAEMSEKIFGTLYQTFIWENSLSARWDSERRCCFYSCLVSSRCPPGVTHLKSSSVSDSSSLWSRPTRSYLHVLLPSAKPPLILPPRWWQCVAGATDKPQSQREARAWLTLEVRSVFCPLRLCECVWLRLIVRRQEAWSWKVRWALLTAAVWWAV